MKVLQLTCHFSPNVGGVETHLDDLTKGLVKRKHKVFVLTYSPLTTKTKYSIFESKANGKLKILRIPWKSGFFYKLVNKPVLEFLYLLPGLFLACPIVIVKEKSNIVHAHGLIAGFIGVFWGKLLRKKVVISTHSIYNFPKKGLYKNFVKFVFSNSDVVLCLSKQSAKEISDLEISEEKVKVFTYWVDLEKFREINKSKEVLGFTGKFIVLFVGRLIEEKGILVLLNAVKEVNNQVLFVIAGAGPLEKKIISASKKNNILFVGKIPQSELPLYYSSADLLIVPSIHEEGFGRVIIESLACGAPVLASDRGGIKEALTEKVGSLITISPKNITDKINHYYTHPKELKMMSKFARKYAEKKYSEKNVEMIINSYES